MPSPQVIASPLAPEIDRAAAAVEAQVIAWRRDLHAHPELGNREFRTAGIVAAHLESLGFDEVRTGVAHTGVVGLLKGAPARAGRRVARRHGRAAGDRGGRPALRLEGARRRGTASEVGVMHACGHDCHVAILMGVAEVLAGLRAQLRGSVKFIFQPAEEMPPEGEEGGAELMIAEGALENPVPQAIFGLHVTSRLPLGIDRLPARPDDGELRQAEDHRARQADARRRALAGRRPDRDGGAGRAGPADGGQPRHRHHARARGRHHRHDPRRRAREHHSRQRRDARHDPRVRRGDARRDPRARDDAGRGRVARLARGLHGVHRQELPGDHQRPRADRGDGADAGARRRRRPAGARAQGDGRGGLLVLPAHHPGPVLLRRRRRRRRSIPRTRTPTIRRASSPTSARWCWACARSRTWPATGSNRSA